MSYCCCCLSLLDCEGSWDMRLPLPTGKADGMHPLDYLFPETDGQSQANSLASSLLVYLLKITRLSLE